MKQKSILFLIIIILITNLSFNYGKEQTISDQEIAIRLKEQKIDVNQASGYQNGKSIIFTLLYDDNNNYRGYRINTIYEENSSIEEDIKQYKKDVKNECIIGEVNKSSVLYQSQEKEMVDIICTQTVGNENAITINNDEVIINPGYGKIEGYLVSSLFFNQTVTNPIGAEVNDNQLFIIDDNGGSAKLQPYSKETTATNSTKAENLIIISLFIVGIIFLLILLRKQINKLFKTIKRKTNLLIFKIKAFIEEYKAKKQNGDKKLKEEKIEQGNVNEEQLEENEDMKEEEEQNRLDPKVLSVERGEHYYHEY